MGASSLAVLLSLGVSWIIKAFIDKIVYDIDFVELDDGVGVEYVILSLPLIPLLILALLYNRRFILDKRTGLVFGLMYITFITFAILVETDVIFDDAC